MPDKNSVIVPFEAKGSRIDLFLASQLPALSRTRLHNLLRDGDISISEKHVKPGYKLKGGETISLIIPAPVPLQVVAEKIDLNILFEDSSIVVINKPAGMVVHPGAGNPEGTLVNALLHHCKDLSGIGGVERPGIVHRIDKDTSGLLVVAKNDLAHASLSEQLKERQVSRRYLAVVTGVVRFRNGTISAPIGRHPVDRKKMSTRASKGKDAETKYRVLKKFIRHTLVEARLHSGRTHQIRVHFESIKHPLLGDKTYCPANKRGSLIDRQALHATALSFLHPVTGNKVSFSCPFPDDYKNALKKLVEMDK